MSVNIDNFPYEIQDMCPEENDELMDYLKGIPIRFVHIGPKKYVLTKDYVPEAATIYNMRISQDDTFVVTYPKSGTTFTQELVWLIANDLDYEKAQSVILNERFPFLEMSTFLGDEETSTVPEHQKEILFKAMAPLNVKRITEMPSPRFIKTHLPLSLLPPTLLDKSKVVYVARDPRDVAVSFYYHYKLMRIMAQDREFKPYWNYFIKNRIVWSPYFDHILEAWEKRNHPNLLFLFYEDLLKDLPAGIRRIAEFLGKELTDEQVAKLHDHLKIDNFRKNKSVNMEDMQKVGILTNEGSFVRKGKAGGWRNYFDEEMTAQAEKWISDNLRNTDFRFPHLNN